MASHRLPSRLVVIESRLTSWYHHISAHPVHWRTGAAGEEGGGEVFCCLYGYKPRRGAGWGGLGWNWLEVVVWGGGVEWCGVVWCGGVEWCGVVE